MPNLQTSSAPTPTQFAALSDDRLFTICKNFGLQSKIWRQKFIALLPEVNRRRLYEKKRFSSIFDFALKLAGISEMQVRRVLCLEYSFKDKPVLKSLLETGKVSINKLVRIASIATPQNQQTLAEQIQNLPQRALETLVRDERKTAGLTGSAASTGQLGWIGSPQPGIASAPLPGSQNQNGYSQPSNDDKSVRAHTFNININKDLKLLENLSGELKDKLFELMDKGIDINGMLLRLIKTREQEIEAKKEQISVEISEKSDAPPSRYIPVKIKNILSEEHGTKCSIQTCQKPALVLHHTARFGLNTIHDPKYMAPLCREHHTLAHGLDRKFADYIKPPE